MSALEPGSKNGKSILRNAPTTTSSSATTTVSFLSADRAPTKGREEDVKGQIEWNKD